MIMHRKNVLAVLLVLVLLFQLAVPCLAAGTEPAVTMTVRPLEADELPPGTTSEDALYGLFVHASGGSDDYGFIGINELQLCFSLDDAILPYDLSQHTAVAPEQLNSNCFQVLGLSFPGKPYDFSVQAFTEGSRTAVHCDCRSGLNVTVKEPQNFFVLYFQIRDNDPANLRPDSIQWVMDGDLHSQVDTMGAIKVQTANFENYVYGGTQGSYTEMPEENVRITGLDQTVSITGAGALAVPKAGEPEAALTLGIDGSGWTEDYPGTPEIHWSMTDPDNTGAVLDPDTGRLSVSNTARAGTVQIQAQVSTGSVVKTTDVQVEITREVSVPAELRLFRDGKVISGSDAVLRPEGMDRQYTYDAVVYDQYGIPMEESVVWSAAGSGGISAADNLVTVTPEAQAGDALTLTASCGTVKNTVQITVAQLTADWSAVDKVLEAGTLTYGQPVSALAALPASGTADAAGETVRGTFAYADSSTVLHAGAHTVEVIFTVTEAGPCQGMSLRKSYTVDVAKKPVTVRADDLEMVYGAAQPTLTFTVPENTLVPGDTAEDLGVFLSSDASSSARPGAYQISGTAASADYAVTVEPGTLTIKPDAVVSIAGPGGSELPQQLTFAAWEANQAESLASLGFPQELQVTYGQNGAAAETAVWDTSLEALQDAAKTASAGKPAKVSVSLSADTFPDWAAVTSELPVITVEILDKSAIPDGDLVLDDWTVTYGDAYTPAKPWVDSQYGTLSFSYTYDGQSEPPTQAGTYTVTVTAENDRFRGTDTATLTIKPRNLEPSMFTLEASSFLYTGQAICPACSVSESASEVFDLVEGRDYTVRYDNNVTVPAAGIEDLPSVFVTAVQNGNYDGAVTLHFDIVPAPLSEETPVIQGSGIAGSVLTASLPAVDSKEYTWQWYRDGEAISGAVSASYVITSADSNHSLTVQAVAAEKNYTGVSAMSAAVQVEKQAIQGTVTISKADGSAPDSVLEVGDLLRATAVVQPEVELAYQWYVDGTAVPGAAEETFTIPDGSSGKAITVSVRPVSENYAGSVTSAAVHVGRTALQGTIALTRNGNTVTASLSGNLNESSCTIVWLRNGVEIPGASGLTYRLTAADLGTVLSARAEARGDYTGQVVSEPLDISAAAPEAPTVSVSAGDRQITIRWQASATGGAPITGYRLTVMAGSTVVLIKDFDAHTTQFTVTELVNGVQYTFTVTAINGTGSSLGGTIAAAPQAPGGGGSIGGGGGGGLPVDPDPEPTFQFIDVAADSWAAPYIYDLYGRGIVQGVGGDRFAPDRTVTRAEFVKLLAGMAGADLTAYAGRSAFADVSPDAWYAPCVAWAVENGVAVGVSDTHFRPDAPITREQMAAMLYRFAVSAEQSLPTVEAPADFSDADRISSWAAEAVSALQQAGLLDGMGDGRFSPDGPATRAQACKILSLLLELWDTAPQK